MVLDIWIYSGRDSGKATKYQKTVDELPLVIQVGNPPPLLELVNRHGLVIFLLVRSFWSILLLSLITICNHTDLLYLGQCSDWSDQSNDSDYVYFGYMGTDHLDFVLDNHLWCTDCYHQLEDNGINGVCNMLKSNLIISLCIHPIYIL